MTSADVDRSPQTATRIAGDGTAIDACHDPGPRELAIVVAHGFTGSWRRPAMRQVASVFGRHAGVVSFDFRGHGRSGGVSTVGDLEVLDLAAAVDWARELGYAQIVTVGFSMGASVVVRHAGLTANQAAGLPASEAAGLTADEAAGLPASEAAGLTIGEAGARTSGRSGGLTTGETAAALDGGGAGLAAVVAISGPSRWWYRGTPAMRRTHWVIERPVGRLISRVALRTRISAAGWNPAPEAPYELVRRIAPVPLLIVHGDADRYFPVEHAEQLYAAASEPKELWLEAGFGHAENAVSPELLQRIATWIADAVTTNGR